MNEKSNVKIKDPFLYKITIQFANLPLEEALKKFKTNYALVTDSKSKKGNIKRIVVVLEGQLNPALQFSAISNKKGSHQASVLR